MILSMSISINRLSKEDFPVLITSQNVYTKYRRNLIYINQNGCDIFKFKFNKSGIYKIQVHTNTKVLLLEKIVEI